MRSVLKQLASSCIAALVVILLTTSAQSCPIVRNHELAQRLEDSGFPSVLLSKAHVAKLEHYGDFLQCEWGFGPYEDWSLYASRQLDDVYWETVVFSAFGFPTHAVGVAEIEARISWEAHAKDNPDTDIYYYLEPGSGAAFRVSRARHTLGDE